MMAASHCTTPSRLEPGVAGALEPRHVGRLVGGVDPPRPAMDDYRYHP